MSSRVLQSGDAQITNPFGISHRGVDVVKRQNQLSAIAAHSAGEVVWCQSGIPNDTGSTGNRSYGNAVKLRHENGMYTLYAHLAGLSVQTGDTVTRGQEIGFMGNTGNSYGAHLHFEVRDKTDTRIDPTPYLTADLPGTAAAPAVTAELWTRADADGALCGVAVRVSRGTVWYQAHVKGGAWLPKVRGFQLSDHENGYAGNGRPIDGVRIYYESAAGDPYRQARYAVKTEKSSGWLPEQADDKTGNGMDGYAGNLGQRITALRLRVDSK